MTWREISARPYQSAVEFGGHGGVGSHPHVLVPEPRGRRQPDQVPGGGCGHSTGSSSGGTSGTSIRPWL